MSARRSLPVALGALVCLALAGCAAGGEAPEAPAESHAPGDVPAVEEGGGEGQTDPAVEEVAKLSPFEQSEHKVPSGIQYDTAEGFFVGLNNSGELSSFQPDGEEIASARLEGTTCASIAAFGTSAEEGHVLVADREYSPAEGLTPELWDIVLRNYDPTNLELRWTATLTADATEQPDCLALNYNDTYLQVSSPAASVTVDGRWLAVDGWYVSLANGTHTATGGHAVATGNLIAVVPEHCYECSADTLPFYEPATGAVAFTLGQAAVDAFSGMGAFDVTQDGSVLVYSSQVASEDLYGNSTPIVAAVSLGESRVLWERHGDSDGSHWPNAHGVLADSSANVAIVDNRHPDAPASYVGRGLRTGEKVYDLPGQELCHTAGTGATLVANNQLVLIDPASGQQLAYAEELTSCPAPAGEWGLYGQAGAVVRTLP